MLKRFTKETTLFFSGSVGWRLASNLWTMQTFEGSMSLRKEPIK